MRHDAREIAARFDLGQAIDLSGPSARGHQGEVWQLTTSTGRWAVKRSFAPIDEHELIDGVQFQEAAHSAGVATPRVVRTLEGTVLATVAFGVVRVDEWVDLADADAGLDPVAVGSTVAALHDVTCSSAGEIDPWYVEGVGAERWVELLDRLVGADAPFAAALLSQLDELVAMEAFVTPPTELRMCHRDLWADNVRRGADQRVWVIDWQDCGAADPTYELAALLFEYAYDDTARARSMYDAYRQAGGPGQIQRPQDFSMAIAQLGHILEISCVRWLAADSADQRRINEARVAEFIDKPLSRGLINQILGAIAGPSASH